MGRLSFYTWPVFPTQFDEESSSQCVFVTDVLQNNVTFGAGEIAQRSRALYALLKDLGLIPSTYITINYSSRSGGSDTLFWHPRLSGTLVAYRQNIYAHENVFKIF